MKKEKIGLILTGGNIELDFLSKVLLTHEVLWVIAVDKGLMAAYDLSLPVDLVIGDFDSVDRKVLDRYKSGMIDYVPKIITLRPEKDMTDTEVALEEGMKSFSEQEEIVIVGATGTRLDHVLANINLLMIPLYNHVKTCILDKNNKIYLAKESFTLKKSNCYGSYVSLLPFTERVTGLTLQGFKYPLKEHTLLQGNSLGVSNEITEESAGVDFTNGILIVVESKD